MHSQNSKHSSAFKPLSFQPQVSSAQVSSKKHLGKKLLGLAFLCSALGTGCSSCEQKNKVNNEASSTQRTNSTEGASAELNALLSKSPMAELQQPASFIPAQMRWVFSSDDAAAWKAVFEKRSSIKALLASPLGEDLKMHDVTLALEALRVQVSQAAQLFGEEDETVLWQGPTALGILDLEKKIPYFVLVKTLSSTQKSALRFASGLLQWTSSPQKESGLNDWSTTQKKISGLTLHQLKTRGQTLSFVFFKDTLILGSSEKYVKHAARLGLNKPMQHKEMAWMGVEKGEDVSALAQNRVPQRGQPGLSVSRHFSKSSLAALLGIHDVGLTFTLEDKVPLKIRTTTAYAKEASFSLLKYAPATTYFALALSTSIENELLENVMNRLSSRRKKGENKKKRLMLGTFRLDENLVQHLSGPIAVVLGALPPDTDGDLQSVVLFSHQKRVLVEKGAQRAFKNFLGHEPEITRLHSLGNATLLHSEGDAPLCVGITDDILILGLDEENVRAALSAGAGQTLSLQDRKGLNLNEKGSARIFIDAEKGAGYLTSFYKASLSKSLSSSWNEAEPVLQPVFSAVAKMGAGSALLTEKQDSQSEGDFVVLP